jgi:hypothetical protein
VDTSKRRGMTRLVGLRLVGLYHSPKLVCEIHKLAPAGRAFSTATGLIIFFKNLIVFLVYLLPRAHNQHCVRF